MQETTDILRLRTLLCLLEGAPEETGGTSIARTLGVEKYQTSRMLIALEKQGLVERANPRRPVLTEKGRKTAEEYAERTRTIASHLIYEGVDTDSAKSDALYGALYNSDASMKIIRESAECYRVKYELRECTRFTGNAVCRLLKDGVYHFPFLIYRETIRNHDNLSMANEGFYQPCTLRIKEGNGIIQLRMKEMEAISGSDGSLMNGHVQNLRYLKDGRYVRAEISGDIISFQAAALSFINIGTGIGIGQVLHGSICLEMECTVGIRHMPQSKAIFTVLI